MAVGTVKWFNPGKGFGFIAPKDGSKDVFVHISAVERAGLQRLAEGQLVEYEIERSPNGKTSATNLTVRGCPTPGGCEDKARPNRSGPCLFLT